MQSSSSPWGACAQACAYTAGDGVAVCFRGEGGAARALAARTEAAKDAASFRPSERARTDPRATFYADWDQYGLDCAVKVRPVDPQSMPW